MQDRVRQALFSILGDRVRGCRFLDLFAGSGVVGIEAWSRGAEVVWWVERDGSIFSILKSNVEALCGAKPTDSQREIRPIRADVWRFLSRPCEQRFDIIFMDPPFALYERGGEWVNELLEKVGENRFLKEEGLFVMEATSRVRIGLVEPWRMVWEKQYGQNRLLGLSRRGE